MQIQCTRKSPSLCSCCAFSYSPSAWLLFLFSMSMYVCDVPCLLSVFCHLPIFLAIALTAFHFAPFLLCSLAFFLKSSREIQRTKHRRSQKPCVLWICPKNFLRQRTCRSSAVVVPCWRSSLVLFGLSSGLGHWRSVLCCFRALVGSPNSLYHTHSATTSHRPSPSWNEPARERTTSLVSLSQLVNKKQENLKMCRDTWKTDGAHDTLRSRKNSFQGICRARTSTHDHPCQSKMWDCGGG